MFNKKKSALKREQRAFSGGKKIRAAVQIALSVLSEAHGDKEIVSFLLSKAEVYEIVPGLDASSLSLPERSDGEQVILAYEWSFLEATDETDLASEILASVKEALESGEISADIDNYTPG